MVFVTTVAFLAEGLFAAGGIVLAAPVRGAFFAAVAFWAVALTGAAVLGGSVGSAGPEAGSACWSEPVEALLAMIFHRLSVPHQAQQTRHRAMASLPTAAHNRTALIQKRTGPGWSDPPAGRS
ncbi:MAG TPA: hypothetical protein VLJ59_17185 [Mycobacteriales bacterium]|nr:hypothetical protein [Mycobacteriales bacterium]